MKKGRTEKKNNQDEFEQLFKQTQKKIDFSLVITNKQKG